VRTTVAGEQPAIQTLERTRTVLSSSGIASDTTHLTSGCATTTRIIIPGFLSLNTADTRTWVSMTTLTGPSEQRRLPPHCQLPYGCGLGAGLVSTSAKCEVLPSERRPVVRLRSSRLQPVAPPRTANRTARLGADLQSPRIWIRHAGALLGRDSMMWTDSPKGKLSTTNNGCGPSASLL
jgi:hypothetical protein